MAIFPDVSLIEPELLGYFSGCITLKAGNFWLFFSGCIACKAGRLFKEDLKELTEEKRQTETELVPDS